MSELRDRPRTEAEFQERMSRLSDRQRAELIVLLGTPPDPQRVPFEFWAKVQREREAALLVILIGIFAASARQHGLSQVDAERAAQAWANERAELVSIAYTERTRELLDAAAERWAADMAAIRSAGAREEVSHEEVQDRLRGYMEETVETDVENNIIADWRDARISVTETTTAAHAGMEEAAEALGIASEEDEWVTEIDDSTCEFCLDLAGEPRSVWEAEWPEGPPRHENCRCFIQYAHEFEFVFAGKSFGGDFKSFCPTGHGGGIDPTCGSGEGGGSSEGGGSAGAESKPSPDGAGWVIQKHIAEPALSLTRHWTGNGKDDIFENPKNWKPEGVPSPHDTIVFPEDCAVGTLKSQTEATSCTCQTSLLMTAGCQCGAMKGSM